MINNLKSIRTSKKLSQEKLGRLVDASFRTIQNYEKNLPENVIIFLKILDALEIDKISDVIVFDKEKKGD